MAAQLPSPKPFPTLFPAVAHWPRPWRRGMALSGAIALVLATSGSQLQADTLTPSAPSNTVAYIATPPGYGLNVRSGPGTQFPAVNTLNRGTALTLSGQYRNGWAQLADGTWVAGNLISFSPLAGTSPVSAPTAPSGTTFTATIIPPPGYHLNLRSGPGTQFPAVNTLSRGTVITVSDRRQNGWVQLVDGSWVAGNWIQIGPPIPGTAPSPSATAPSTPTPPPNGDLRVGSQGEAVTRLQTRLQALGYLPANYQPTGTFDPITQVAVENFQRIHNLPADGLVGPATRDLLYSANARMGTGGLPPISSPSPSPSPTTSPSPTASPSPIPTTSPTASPSPSPTASPTANPSPSPTASPSPSPATSPSPSPTASPSPSPSPSPTNLGPQSVRIRTDNGMEMPVFSGPGTEFDLVEFLPDGSTVRITGLIQGNWAELESGQWVYRPWLAL